MWRRRLALAKADRIQRRRLLVFEEVRFAADSSLEGNGFEPSVPRCARTADSATLV
jgi:hypothetical protein